MHEIRRTFEALTLVALAACGGTNANANAKFVEPLVIPPMGSAAVAQPPPPPPPPSAPHSPSAEECEIIMRRIVDLTLDQAMINPSQREELVKSFTANSEMAKQACGALKVDDESMRCITDAPKLDEMHKCLATMRSAKSDDDDDDR